MSKFKKLSIKIATITLAGLLFTLVKLGFLEATGMVLGALPMVLLMGGVVLLWVKIDSMIFKTTVPNIRNTFISFFVIAVLLWLVIYAKS